MISVYDIQQSIEQSLSFGLKAHVRQEGVVAGYKGERDIAVVRSLSCVSRRYASCTAEGAHPWINHTWCLHQDNLLQELDTAHAHAWWSCVHSSQDIRFDRRHELPVLGIVGVVNTGARKYKTGFDKSATGRGRACMSERTKLITLMMENKAI